MTDIDKIQLRTEPYESEEARVLLDQKGCGAVLWFEGVMKEVLADGTRVSQLDWDAYQSMAIKSLNELRDRAIHEFDLKDLILIHRIDTQFPGDLIMTLGVSSERRKGAIAAIGWFMDELKQLAPLWKREKLVEGKERWVEGEPES
ncbi:MAG: molybdenum cofactor biosynthesis protein MoaE [Candidatus Omnitrophica bacterium]|nr:molybdenum cofactor biosynthesis protein MoaE [Candidatus Omnitrophota bacterium]